MIIHKKYKYVFYGLTSITLLVISTFLIPVIDKTEPTISLQQEYLFTSNDNFEVLKREYGKMELGILEVLLFIDPKTNTITSSDLIYLLKNKLQSNASRTNVEQPKILLVSSNLIKVIYFVQSEDQSIEKKLSKLFDITDFESLTDIIINYQVLSKNYLPFTQEESYLNVATYVEAVLNLETPLPDEFTLEGDDEIFDKYLQQNSGFFNDDSKVETLAQSRLKISITRSQGDILESELTNIENILSSDFYLIASGEIIKTDNRDDILFNDRLRGFLIGSFLLAFLLLVLIFVKLVQDSKSPYWQILRIRSKNKEQSIFLVDLSSKNSTRESYSDGIFKLRNLIIKESSDTSILLTNLLEEPINSEFQNALSSSFSKLYETQDNVAKKYHLKYTSFNGDYLNLSGLFTTHTCAVLVISHSNFHINNLKKFLERLSSLGATPKIMILI